MLTACNTFCNRVKHILRGIATSLEFRDAVKKNHASLGQVANYTPRIKMHPLASFDSAVCIICRFLPFRRVFN